MTHRDALSRVDRLIKFFARKYTADRPDDRDELYREAVALFLARFGEFDQVPHHLPVWTRYMCQVAARAVRRRADQYAVAGRVGCVPDYSHPAALIPRRGA